MFTGDIELLGPNYCVLYYNSKNIIGVAKCNEAKRIIDALSYIVNAIKMPKNVIHPGPEVVHPGPDLVHPGPELVQP